MIDIEFLKKHGYVVVNVLTREEADDHKINLVKELEDLYGGEFDSTIPDTTSNRFAAKRGGMEQHLGVGHLNTSYEIRSHPKIRNTWAELWDLEPTAKTATDIGPALLSSIDGVCHSPAPENLRKTLATHRMRIADDPTLDSNKRNNWLHLDQTKRGFQCYQGFVTLEDIEEEDATVVFIEGSHLKHDEFMDEVESTGRKFKGNWFLFDEEHVEWFTDRAHEIVQVEMNKGDMVIWDSRLVHQGSYPKRGRKVIRDRTVVYISMAPVSMCSKADLKKKQNIFWSGDSTSHWPHKNIKAFPYMPRLWGPTPECVEERYEIYKERKREKLGPSNIDKLTDTQKRLMGIMEYP